MKIDKIFKKPVTFTGYYPPMKVVDDTNSNTAKKAKKLDSDVFQKTENKKRI